MQGQKGRLNFVSIDLSTRIGPPLNVRALLPEVSLVLRDMLGIGPIPLLTLDVLEDGRRSPATACELADRSSPFFLISMRGEPETAGLMTDGAFLTVTMAAQRTSLEFALGAAVALAAARRFGGMIEDPWRFFSPNAEISGEDLLRHLRPKGAPAAEGDIRHAAARLHLGASATE